MAKNITIKLDFCWRLFATGFSFLSFGVGSFLLWITVFPVILTTEWKRAIRHKTPISLIMIDIDHFKQYNDHYGHGAGDICLQRVAAALAKMIVRPSDLIARYGGEEFVVILPDTNQQAALKVA
jgi:diguanylate cyclase (GGDEF)-like protein